VSGRLVCGYLCVCLLTYVTLLYNALSLRLLMLQSLKAAGVTINVGLVGADRTKELLLFTTALGMEGILQVYIYIHHILLYNEVTLYDT
jgi:hypothetical protein